MLSMMLSRTSILGRVHFERRNLSMEYIKAPLTITLLAEDEEQYLVNCAVEMNQIGYGQTRR